MVHNAQGLVAEVFLGDWCRCFALSETTFRGNRIPAPHVEYASTGKFIGGEH